MAVSAAYGAAAADWTRQPEQELGQGIDAQAGAPKMRANDVHALGLDGLIGGLKQPMMQAYSTAHTPGTERDQVLLHRMVSWQNARQREKQALVFRSEPIAALSQASIQACVSLLTDFAAFRKHSKATTRNRLVYAYLESAQVSTQCEHVPT